MTIINPVIVLDKEANTGSVVSGGQVVYTYRVTNPGDNPLANVAVTDDRCGPVTFAGGDADDDAKLDPSETWTFNCTAVLTTVASVTNIGSATGTDTLGRTVSATDAATVAVLALLGVVDETTSGTTTDEVLAVLGVVAQRTLPRTGGAPLGWAVTGSALVLGGLVLIAATVRRRRPSTH